MLLYIICLSACDSGVDSDAKVLNSGEEAYMQEEEIDMKLYINEKEVSVTWFNNESVKELDEDVKNHNIVVEMSMYGGNEQFGSLGKEYSSDDKRMTTECGDIVLYDNDNIVVFYGSNTWEYTKLGKMNLSEDEIIELLGNGDVILKLKY